VDVAVECEAAFFEDAVGGGVGAGGAGVEGADGDFLEEEGEGAGGDAVAPSGGSGRTLDVRS
jgi:hypothetical protein